jgi:hypothetical protein
MIPIPLPYDLKHDELNLDPADSVASADIHKETRWLADNVRDDDEAERIFRGAIVLYHSNHGEHSFAQCLRTATIWERG